MNLNFESYFYSNYYAQINYILTHIFILIMRLVKRLVFVSFIKSNSGTERKTNLDILNMLNCYILFIRR